MKKGNYLDPRTRSPDPDDLTSEQPARPPASWERGNTTEEPPDELRPNPDSSAPHVPPADVD